ncbi:porin [Granulosicoccaceae sp. 1_MG-2023]|nr:porin [Granulosicoccaceae sp. 1_MG-2023]
MKKHVIASAVTAVLCSGAASAATVYQQDELKLDLKGDLQVQLFQKPGEDQDMVVDYDDLELKFGAEYDLGNNMAAFGKLELDWKNQGDGSDDDIVDDAYVGLKFNAMSVSLGRMYWASDDFAAEKAIEMDGGTAFPETGGTETLKFEYSDAMFGAVVSYDLEEEDGDSTVFEVVLTTKLAMVDLGVAYQSYEDDPSAAGSESIDTLGILASADAGPVNLAFDFTSNDDLDAINFAASVPFAETVEGAAGVTQHSPDEGDDVLYWYANVTKAMHKNVSVFAEIGNSDEDDSDMGFLAGMRVKF